MGSRRGRTPPYEIMRSVGSGSPLPRPRRGWLRSDSGGLAGVLTARLKSIGAGLAGFIGDLAKIRGLSEFQSTLRRATGKMGRPIEVRLPWPVLALLGVVGLALMGLMFQVGQHVAGRSAEPGAVATRHSGQNPDVAAGESSSPGGVSHDGTEPSGNPGGGSVVAMGSLPGDYQNPGGGQRTVLNPVETPGGGGGIALTDPRAVGLNYYILATVTPGEVTGVRNLQKFLADNGLETYLDKANNDRFRVLVDVTRGFSRDELRNLDYGTHEQRIRLLGKQWKKQQGGLGTDLSDIYRDRYDGPTE